MSVSTTRTSVQLNGQKLHKRLKPDLQYLNGKLMSKLYFEKQAEGCFSDDTVPRNSHFVHTRITRREAS